MDLHCKRIEIVYHTHCSMKNPNIELRKQDYMHILNAVTHLLAVYCNHSPEPRI